jgi:hypothetical protein
MRRRSFQRLYQRWVSLKLSGGTSVPVYLHVGHLPGELLRCLASRRRPADAFLNFICLQGR